MRVSVLAYKNDFRDFLRKNTVKFILFSVIILITAIIAVKNGLILENFCDYFEKKSNIELRLIRGEKTIFSYLLLRLIESVIIFALIVACSYNDFTALFCPLILIYKVYKNLFVDVIILRYLGICAIIYFIIRIITLILYELAYSCACSLLINNSCRYCYGFNEITGVFKSLIPSVIGVGIIIIVESVLIGITLIFI